MQFDSLSISNGVRQGGVLSPMFFSIYTDELSNILTDSCVGCSISNVYINHLFYADDIVDMLV